MTAHCVYRRNVYLPGFGPALDRNQPTSISRFALFLEEPNCRNETTNSRRPSDDTHNP